MGMRYHADENYRRYSYYKRKKDIKGSIFRDETIIDDVNDQASVDCVIDAKNCYVCPGFIDIHTHGAGGYDYLDNTPEAF